eukprot:CAMPEP_0196146522 /NCGR_PEP_ID=MMETSP0910-20130528/23192_1 /TAXON_ID=49265 /ORGANISM="Thalassiosira rotula, Strain GSO102" /LENGTH=677 /DNA_ID=CAMNT_0041408729 /DNA_START=394 /DNA_END=2427 /DNA_ORIENTATION=-
MSDPPEESTSNIPVGSPPTPVESEEGGDNSKEEQNINGVAASQGEDDIDGTDGINGIDGIDDTETKAAPQAQEIAPSPGETPVENEGELIECKLTPVDGRNQRNSLRDALTSDVVLPSLESNGDGEAGQYVEEYNNDNDIHQQSALHQDEYSQYNDRKQYNPHNHESALAAASHPATHDMASNNNTNNNGGSKLNKPFAKRNKSRMGGASGGGRGGATNNSHGGGRHSHPRKSPYRSEIARLRHAQKLEREKRKSNNPNHHAPPSPSDVSTTSTTASGKSITLKDTTGPPDTAFFSIQSSKLKHSLLHSLGEFLTSAFADDEESSGSYFSQDLLDQLSNSNPNLKGVWLQAKNLNDSQVKHLSEALIRNKVATEVWLPSNQITDEGACHIAHMLKFNKTIKELFLGENQIGPKGAAALAGALARGNSTLVALGLGDNKIGVEGAGAFAAALRHNHSLHTLDVKNNNIPRKSSIRGLLNKMLEFNASDPGDESLVLGLQEELANLVGSLPPEIAESVVLQAEEALKTAMLCRRRGDKVGAAEAEGIFIRICTTGEPPVDPPEEMAQRSAAAGGGSVVRHRAATNQNSASRKKNDEPMEPECVDELNAKASTTLNVENDDEGSSVKDDGGVSEDGEGNDVASMEDMPADSTEEPEEAKDEENDVDDKEVEGVSKENVTE